MRKFRHGSRYCAALIAAVCFCSQDAWAQSDTPKLLDETVAKGIKYLRETGQAEDGTFSSRVGPGLTAMALTALLQNGLTPDDPMVAKALKALETFVKPDGGIYGNGRIKNYETCVAILAFNLANTDGRYNQILKDADGFVRGLQY
jgi:hypothetical protein